MKKLVSLLLCAAMLFSLCACGNAQETAVTRSAEAESEETEEATGYVTGEDAEALILALAEKYDSSALVLTAGNMEINWGVFYYFIQSNLSTFTYYYDILPVDYSAETEDGESMDSAIMESIESYITRFAAAQERSALTEEQLDEDFDAYWEDLIEQFGDEEVLNEQLAAAGYTKDTLRFFDYANAYVQDAFYGAYGEDFAEITDELVENWVAENGYVRAKHILLMTDEELSEEENAAKKQQLEDIRTELMAIEDNAEREAAFDEKMNALTEDGGLVSYPDGYTFASGTMVEEFEDAAFALEDYAISEVVETSYGYHLLMGLPVEKDNIVEYDSSTYEPITVANSVANDDFTAKLSAWAEDVTIEYTEEFEGFTVQSLFEDYEQTLADYYATEAVAEEAENEALTLPAGVDGIAEDGKLHVYPYGESEEADTSDSAVIDSACYYESGHLILSVGGKTRVFVNVPASVWEEFKASEVKGTFYKKYLKGNAAYAVSGVPAGKEVDVVVE